jgi:2-keto-4-pentenoate hydratase
MRRMLELRSDRLARGERAVGWKLAFGAPASLERFGLNAPLVGFITDATSQPSPGSVSCAGWRRPVAEPEIAVYISADVEPGSGDVADSIGALGPAIELADVDPPPENIEEILAENIFHRGVVLGEPDPARAGGKRDDFEAHIDHAGTESVVTEDLESLTGDLVEVVGHCARLLDLAGARLVGGDVVVIGSIVPPLAIEPGQEVVFELAPLPAISVQV